MEIMFCNNCGMQHPDGTKFCNNCGSQLVQPTRGVEYQTYAPTQIPTQATYTPVTPPPQKKNNTALIIAAVVAVILVVAVTIAVVCIKSSKKESETVTGGKGSTSESVSENTESTGASEQVSDSGEENEEQTPVSKPIRGTIEGNVYTNDFAEITFTKPNKWIYASDEELAELIGITVDELGYNSLEQALMEQIAIYDMMAVSAAGAPNVSVMFEDLVSEGWSDCTEEEYADTVAKGLESLTDEHPYTVFDQFETELCGRTYTAFEAELISNGATRYQRYHVRKRGKYMIVIIFTVNEESEYTEIENMF